MIGIHMTLKLWALLVVFLVVLQMSAAYIIVLSNRDIFDKYRATGYFEAIKELSKIKPKSAFLLDFVMGYLF
jgi:hypothetical protein